MTPDTPTRRALVCGASSGLGAAVAQRLAAQGIEVVAVARREAELHTLAMDAPGKIHPLVWDLNDPTRWDALPDTVRSTLDGYWPDIVVHNGGGPKPGNILQLSLKDWETAFHQQFLRVVALDHHFVSPMVGRGWGRVIAITSLAVMEPVQDLPLSNAMRAALTAYLKTLANEVAAHGVTVNAVAPGWIETTRLQSLFQVGALDAEKTATIPAKRLGTPDEFASLVAYLCGEDAGYVTGSTFCVDGGLRRSVF